MRTLGGLFMVLLLLGSFGMGILMAVDSPPASIYSTSVDDGSSPTDNHGTRAAPSENPIFVNLYFRSANNIMNTTASSASNPVIEPVIPGSPVTFTLQNPLMNNFMIQNPSPGYPIVARVYLSGTGSVDITVQGNGGSTVGTRTYPTEGQFTFGGTPQPVDIDIAFSSGSNYTFNAGNVIVINFEFTNTGRLHYASTNAPSRLQLYGNTIPDITITTDNFNGDSTDRFYPRDIDFPDDENRRQVKMSGVIKEVFGKQGNIQYVNDVEVVIKGPGTDLTRTCDFDKSTFVYSYTWNYVEGQEDGLYNITTHVMDEQGNEFTVVGNFNMSAYGVLLTSPSQVPKEGSYRAEARRNLVEGSFTTYEIKVWNTGNDATSVALTTNGQFGWDWWLSGTDLAENNNKSGRIDDIPAGAYKTVFLSVDSLNNKLGSPPATIFITASSVESPIESHILTTISTIVRQFDIELEFTSGSSPKEVTSETGNTIQIKFTAENKGAEEDTVLFTLSSVPAGWTLSMSGSDLQGSQAQYYVVLDSLEKSNDIILSITTATDKEEKDVKIEIIGKSQGSSNQGDIPVEQDKLEISVTTTLGIKLELDDEIEKDVDPNDDLAFRFKLTNTGTSLANITVTFSGISSSDGWEDEDVSLEPSFDEDTKLFSNLAPNNAQTFWIYVKPTLEVYAKNYTITLRAERNDAPSLRYQQQAVFCHINEVFNVELLDPISQTLSAKAEPGSDVTFTIKLKNSGNTKERINVVTDKPKDWDLDFGNASSEWSKLVEPGDEETITLVFSIPDDAQGDETQLVTISIIPAVSDPIFVESEIEITQRWYEPVITLIVPLLLFVVLVVMVIVIYKRRQ